VAATKGHKVVLAEAEPHLGGALKLAWKAPFRPGFRDIVDWLEQEVYRLGVDVRVSTYIEAEDVSAFEADAIIIATGSIPRMDGVQTSNPGEPIIGMDQPHVLSSNELFGDHRRKVGTSAVVIDDTGHYEAVAAAEHLMQQGVDVTFVTRHISFAPQVEMALMSEPALVRMARLGGLKVHTRTRAVEIKKNSVTIAPVFAPLAPNSGEEIAADMVIFVSPNLPNRDLYDQLVGMGTPVQTVGDAKAPRFLQHAIREGNRAGASL
jgi:NADPH-dependent 2,4-dienoyl-CoA reductase/sulfur reductase-like enzyme